MADRPDLRVALGFLAKLRKNNNKAWFDENKELYQQALAQFEALVAHLITGVGGFEDLAGVSPKDCIMRIYRDVRFSRDKTPYKTGFGAGIAPGGRKSGRMGYHLHLEPGATMVATGLWDPTPEQIGRYREAVGRDPDALRAIMESASFRKHFDGLYGEVLKNAPKGYAADHPAIDLLRRKQVCVTETFPDDAVTSPRFVEMALASMKAMKPFADYLDRLGGSRRG